MDGAGGRVKFCRVFALVAVLVGASGAPASAATPEIPKRLPDGYMVLAFENQSGVAGLEWMRIGLPVILGEKLEAHPGLRPTYGRMVLPSGAPPAAIDAAAVARAGRAQGALFVWTGEYTRKNWKLELTVRLWKIDGETATLVGEKTEYGDFGRAFAMLDEAILELVARAGRPAPAATADAIRRAPTQDFYAYTLYGRGVLALHGLGRAQDLAKAEKDLARSVFIDPKFAEAHRMLALLYEAKGQPAKARGQLVYALDLRPDYYAPLAALVAIAVEAKERDEAIALATRALALRPWDHEVRFALGAMLWEEGDVDGAHLELSRLTAAKPDHLAARRVLVLVHSAKGDGASLAAELEKILQLDPDDEAARLDLGAAYHALGRDPEAIAIYEAVVEKNPKHLQALKFLGDLHKSRGELGRAIVYYERALAANRNDPRPYFLLGAAYVEAGDDKKAIRIYLQAQRFTRYLGDAFNNLGAIYYRMGRNDEALWYLGIAAKKKPSSAKVHYNHGLALVKAHRRDQAIESFTRAAELDPTDAEIRYAMGVVLLRMGRLEDAEAAFEEAARLDPQHEHALHNLRLIDDLRRRAQEGEVQQD